MAEKNTLREAMVAHALEEIDSTVKQLENVTQQVAELSDTLPAYFEDASNDVSDIIKRGVEADLKNAKERLKQVHKEVSDSIEMQRRLNKQLQSLVKSISNKNNPLQLVTTVVAGFLGSFLGVLLTMIILK